MSEQRSITLNGVGSDVTLEVTVGYEKPAAIDVALYGPDKKKEKDVGSAFSGTASDPQSFDIAPAGNIAPLQGRTLGVFVAISSFTPSDGETVTVSSQVRQGASAVANSMVLATSSVVNGGAGIIIAYSITVN
jgi:hypothetical protein